MQLQVLGHIWRLRDPRRKCQWCKVPLGRAMVETLRVSGICKVHGVTERSLMRHWRCCANGPKCSPFIPLFYLTIFFFFQCLSIPLLTMVSTHQIIMWHCHQANKALPNKECHKATKCHTFKVQTFNELPQSWKAPLHTLLSFPVHLLSPPFITLVILETQLLTNSWRSAPLYSAKIMGSGARILGALSQVCHFSFTASEQDQPDEGSRVKMSGARLWKQCVAVPERTVLTICYQQPNLGNDKLVGHAFTTIWEYDGGNFSLNHFNSCHSHTC